VDDVDDRLAQFEALQVLFTLLLGLVLQLQASSASGDDADALGVLLVLLNAAVIVLALVQQPLTLRLARYILLCRRALVVRLHARDYVKMYRRPDYVNAAVGKLTVVEKSSEKATIGSTHGALVAGERECP
jgi:hypothetical protein